MVIEFILKFVKRDFSIKITEKPAVIGRAKKCDYSVPDAKLSSRHCLLYIKDSMVIIEDLNSKNGVFLNGVKIQKQKLYLNDHIAIGDCELIVNRLKLSEESLKLLGPLRENDRDITLELCKPIEPVLELTKKENLKRSIVKIQHNKKKANNSKRRLIFLFIIVLFFFIILITKELLS